MLAFERGLQKAKLLVALAAEAKDKLVLNEKYLRHLRQLQDEAVRTSVDLKTCHEDRSSDAISALQELMATVGAVDRNTEAVDQLKERVQSLGLNVNWNASAALAASPRLSAPALASARVAVQADVKRVRSDSPGFATREVACGPSTSSGGDVQESYPKKLSKNSIIKHFDLPRDHEEFFQKFRSDRPSERNVQRRRLASIREDDENPPSTHAPIM